jgi:hypothetical protein
LGYLDENKLCVLLPRFGKVELLNRDSGVKYYVLDTGVSCLVFARVPVNARQWLIFIVGMVPYLHMGWHGKLILTQQAA